MKKLTHHGHLAAQIKGTANSRYSSALDNKGQNNLSMKDPPPSNYKPANYLLNMEDQLRVS